MATSGPIPLSTTPVNETVLPAPPAEAQQALDGALNLKSAFPEKVEEALAEVAARWPEVLDAWSELGRTAYGLRRDIQAYAYFRVAYHRGLDLMRQHGWRGDGVLPWKHASNRGFLTGLHGLMLCAAAIGEVAEATRCREFLMVLDPHDHFSVSALGEADLRSRLPG